ncbi:MAG: DUF4404 family protein [Oceanospirillaceae bacterium]|nr:DUF4404 family protein [Oceanospirillaceae bacterium]MCP5335530.1 DUF4404 family protein [Oceanospirillaceae bacterium]MCP5350001.1 DUF4404 family protein [Oceanospirillaceae bacterium]
MSENLKKSLQQLHQTLAQTQDVDSETLNLLNQVAQDIQRVAEGERPANLVEQVELQTVKFEGQYPQVSAVLRDVLDALAKMGI